MDFNFDDLFGKLNGNKMTAGTIFTATKQIVKKQHRIESKDGDIIITGEFRMLIINGKKVKFKGENNV